MQISSKVFKEVASHFKPTVEFDSQASIERISSLFNNHFERKSIARNLLLLQPDTLILSASVGMGHVKAGDGCLEALQSEYSAEKSAHLDILRLLPSTLRNIYSKGYLALQERAPLLLGMLYSGTDSEKSNSELMIRLDRIMSKQLEKLLIKINPPKVISTHFMASRIVGALKKEGLIQSKLYQVVTDFDLHKYWHVPQTDHYFVAGRPALDRLCTIGVSQDKISISGIPISKQFEVLPNKFAARDELGIRNNLPTLLVTLGGAGRAPYEPVVEALLKLKNPANILVVCGKNELAFKRIAERWNGEKIPSHLHLQVHGFTDKMPVLMAASDLIVGKPGGLTMSEALASGLVPIIVQPTPGQEERNSDYLLEEGVALRCRYLDQLGLSIDRLLFNPTELVHRSQRSKCLSHSDAGKQISKLIHEY